MKHQGNSSRLTNLWALTATILFIGAAPAQSQTPQAPDFLVTVPSAYDFDETIRQLKSGIEEQNLMVLHEINPQQMLRMVGVRTGGMRQLLFFHPRYMKQIIEANRNGGIEPPLKILVMEMPNGRVIVRYMDLNYQFGRYAGLEEIGRELAGVVDAVMATVRN